MQFFNFYGIPVITALFIIWMIFFCMVCGFGIQGKGFLSETMRNFWIVSMVFLILLHIVSCIMFYRSRNHTLHMMTAIFPSIIFILTGLLEQDPPLLLFAIIFAIGKIYMTAKSES